MKSSMRQLYKKSTARIPTLLLCVCLTFGLSATGLAQTFSAAQATGGIGNDAGTAIAADAAGNTYVTGYFSDAVTFGPGQTRTSTGGSDIFVAKYDPAGNLVWVQQAGGAKRGRRGPIDDCVHGVPVGSARAPVDLQHQHEGLPARERLLLPHFVERWNRDQIWFQFEVEESDAGSHHDQKLGRSLKRTGARSLCLMSIRNSLSRFRPEIRD